MKPFVTSPVWIALLFIVWVEVASAFLQLPAYNTLASRLVGSDSMAYHRVMLFLTIADFLRPFASLVSVPLVSYFAFMILLLTGSWTSFRNAFAMVVASQAPIVLSAVVSGVFMFFRAPFVYHPRDLLVPSGLDAILPLHTPLSVAVAGTLSIYMIWSVLIFIRMGQRQGLKLSSLFIASTALWLPGFLMLLVSKPPDL